MVDRQRLGEIRSARDHRLVERTEPHRDRARLHAGDIEHVAQAHAEPFGVAHRPVTPLRTGNRGLEQRTRIARALVDRRQLDAWQLQQLRERDRQRPRDRAVHLDPERLDIDRGRNVGPVPADEELVVRCEDVAIEHAHRRFQQRRVDPLEDHAALAGERTGYRPFRWATRKMQVDHALRQRGCGDQRAAADRSLCEKATAVRRLRQFHIQAVHQHSPFDVMLLCAIRPTVCPVRVDRMGRFDPAGRSVRPINWLGRCRATRTGFRASRLRPSWRRPAATSLRARW